jgi:hypothetical protein
MPHKWQSHLNYFTGGGVQKSVRISRKMLKNIFLATRSQRVVPRLSFFGNLVSATKNIPIRNINNKQTTVLKGSAIRNKTKLKIKTSISVVRQLGLDTSITLPKYPRVEGMINGAIVKRSAPRILINSNRPLKKRSERNVVRETITIGGITFCRNIDSIRPRRLFKDCGLFLNVIRIRLNNRKIISSNNPVWIFAEGPIVAGTLR